MASAAPPAVSHHESLRAKLAERVRLRNQANHPYARNETQLCAPSQQHQQQQPQQPKPQPQQRGKSNQPTQSSQVRSSITPLIAPRERGARSLRGRAHARIHRLGWEHAGGMAGPRAREAG